MGFETETLICASLEQGLATNQIRKHIRKTGKSDIYGLCKEKPETVHHIVSGCNILCVTQYLYWHNQVAKYIHWQILKDLNVEVPESWLKHIPSEVTIKDCTRYKPTRMYDHYCRITCMYEYYQKKVEKIN